MLLVAVVAYEVAARDEQLLSRGVDRARAKHPALDAAITSAIVVTAGHLLRVWPARLDPFGMMHGHSRSPR